MSKHDINESDSLSVVTNTVNQLRELKSCCGVISSMVELLKRSCKTLECFIVYTLILDLDSFRKQYIVFWFFLEYDVGETKLTEKILSH